MLISLLLAIFKPYKKDYMNYCELVILGTASVFVYLWLTTHNPHSALTLVLVLIVLLPHIALVFYIFFAALSLKKDTLREWMKKKLEKYNVEDTGLRQVLGKFCVKMSAENEDIPDRCVHPDLYTTKHKEDSESVV